jgi:hypothetical protein
MRTHKLMDPNGRPRASARCYIAWLWTTGSIGVNRLAGQREWLGGPEATSTRAKQLTGRAFATRVRRITDHLNDKISHIRIESRNIVMRALASRTTFSRKDRGTADPSASLGMTKERATIP